MCCFSNEVAVQTQGAHATATSDEYTRFRGVGQNEDTYWHHMHAQYKRCFKEKLGFDSCTDALTSNMHSDILLVSHGQDTKRLKKKKEKLWRKCPVSQSYT